MGTFPTAYEYGRPIPQGTTGYVQAPSIPAPPQESMVGAQATADAAHQIEKVGQKVEDYSQILDTTQAQDAMNQLRKERQTLTYGDDGFQKIQGGNVLKPTADGQSLIQSYNTRLTAAQERIAQGLTPRARMLFATRAGEEANSFSKEILSHQLQESEKYDKGVFNDTIATLGVELARNIDNPQVADSIVAKMVTATESYLTRKGLPTEGAKAEAQSGAYATVISMQVNAGNNQAALATFSRYGDKLTPADKLKLMPAIETIQRDVTAKVQTTLFTSGGAPTTEQAIAGTKTSMAFWQSPDDKGEKYSPQVAAGITAGFLNESQFFPGARNKGDGRDGSDSIHIGQWNSARAQAFAKFVKDKGLDPNDVKTGLIYAKAEIDGEVPYSVSGLSPDFKARLQNAKSEKEAADLMTREYFRPLNTARDSAIRQGSATKILEKYGTDPLIGAVNQATGTKPAERDGPLYQDPDVMLLQANAAYAEATRRNQETNVNDDKQRTQTQTEIDLWHAAQKRQIDQQRLFRKIQLNDVMTSGGGTSPDGRPLPPTRTDQIPVNLWNQLSFQERESVTNIIKHNAKGVEAVTDQQHWYQIQRGLTSSDPAERQKWADYDLWQSKDKLNNSDMQELAKIQGAVRKGDPDKELTHVGSVNQMVGTALNSIGIDPTPKPSSGANSDAVRAAKFQRAVQEQLTAFETQKGKKATTEEIQKIIDQQVRQVAGTGGLFSSSKRRFEMTVKDVPATERAKIEDALKRNGKPVTDDAIIDLYTLKAGK